MAKTRILVVDDSAVFRRFVTEALNADPALEVVGTAANGKIALAKMPQVNPDLVILDVEMPEMDGLETLREIRKTYRRLPVIMFSALTERGASATLDALALGATDYFTKPTTAGMDASLQIIRDELIPAIKALARTEPSPPSFTPTIPLKLGSAPRSPQAQTVEVVAVGVSTGGPNALAELFSGFAANFRVPIVVVQHMPPMFTRFLSERLSAQSRIKVEEGFSGGLLSPGHAWVAPGDYHMTLARDAGQVRIQINQDPPENSCRPAVDVLFRSVAKTFGSSALAVVLTGMGQDGLRGCEAIREAGGQVLAQDEASSVVWGMPGFVARAGLADRILPLAMIAPEIVSRVQVGRGVDS